MSRSRALHRVAWAVTVILGALEAWVARHTTNTDGLSYLDIGDAYVRSDWAAAVNAYWSPLYSWLLGGALVVLRPSPYWEFGVAHLVNFAVYLATFACFSFFLDELQRPRGDPPTGPVRLSEISLRLVGYALFWWSSLHWIRLTGLHPDMCVASLVYLGAALLLRVRRKDGGFGTMAVLGLLMGVGYLAKATMFPLAFLFLGLAAFDRHDLRRSAALLVAGVIVFAVVAGPFVVALSLQKGRPTFSDSGKIHYAWCVNGVRFSHWRGDPPGSGVPKHPTRQIFDDPQIYEFGTPVAGTFPEWDDPSYWYDGIQPRYADVAGLAHIIGETSRRYLAFVMLRTFVATALAAATCLAIARRSGRRVLRDAAEHWPFFVLALTVFTIYSILNVEIRRIAPFVVLSWIGICAGLRFASSSARRAADAVAIGLAVVFAVALTATAVPRAMALARDVVEGERRVPHEHWQVADGLRRVGLDSGDRVGFVGIGSRLPWARLAHVKVIARLEGEERFWNASHEVQERALGAFGAAGAKIVVAYRVPRAAVGWRRIGDTDFYATTPPAPLRGNAGPCRRPSVRASLRHPN